MFTLSNLHFHFQQQKRIASYLNCTKLKAQKELKHQREMFSPLILKFVKIDFRRPSPHLISNNTFISVERSESRIEDYRVPVR